MSETDLTGVPLVRLSGVEMSWGRRKVLSDVDLTVNKGDFIAITGPNGGGKTTLLRIMLRLLKPTRGTVEYFSNGHSSLRLSYLPQKNMIDYHFPITVEQVIAMGLEGTDISPKCEEGRKRMAEMLDLTGLGNHRDSAIGSLSGGQLQRALLGRALISRPEVLVLDEPLSYVDKRFEHRFYHIMQHIKSFTTIVLVSHEITEIAAMANRHINVDGHIEICHSASHFVRYGCDLDHDPHPECSECHPDSPLK